MNTRTDRIDRGDYDRARRGYYTNGQRLTASQAVYHLRHRRYLRSLWLAAEETYDHAGREVMTWSGDKITGDPARSGFRLVMTTDDRGDDVCDDDCHDEIDPRDVGAPRGMARGPAWLHKLDVARANREWLRDETGDRHTGVHVSVDVFDPDGTCTYSDGIGSEMDLLHPYWGDAQNDAMDLAMDFFGDFAELIRDAAATWDAEQRERMAYPDMVTTG